MFAVHSCVLPPRNFRHAFNRPIHFDEWYSKFLGHGQLEKHPSFPYVVFIIHCAFMAGRRPPQRKSWVPSHQCIGSSNLSVMLYTWNIPFCLCQYNFFTQLFSAIDREMSN